MTNQLTLDLGLRAPTYDRRDFMVAPGNREALAWIERPHEWPGPALALVGPPGCGKTHLVHIWAARAGAAIFDGVSLEGKGIPDLSELVAGSRAIAIDNAERSPERTLLHLYNLLLERRSHLLLTSASPPAHWPMTLPDLASRLRAALAVEIAPPDDELLGSIILKQLADRQLHAGAGVVQYLVSHMERSGEAARRIVAALDRRALAERREIDRRLAADVLAEMS